MLPTRVCQHTRRILIDHFDVGDKPRARIEALKQIVREQRVLGHAAFEGCGEGVHVIQALAGEDALAEEVLVHVRHRRGVRVHARVTGVGARKERSGCAGHGHAHPRLQDAVATGHAAKPAIEPRLIQRMGNDADEFPGGIARQAGV